MGDEKTITVADISDGPCSRGEPGTSVSLPVVELLTGRGFVTGKSGSGKSNSASVVAEKLLDNGFGLLIVDIDGEYYGLKEEYEILHAGGDEECDIQVTPEHAEKLATLALEQNVPIILDVSSFLDESEARELLTAVAKQLFVKEKKLKQPFLMLVEEIHEYIPENGGLDECGRMLIKVGKRGRKHGLGITGISQRPADVKKDFITQCDWLLWHRLTWNNDTNVVQRIIDAEHADAVEDLNDGEGFLMTDWAESVRRVQFHRKQTFDAGATPGLEDFERPDLKSVSENLVSELESISEAEQEREDRIAELKEELDKKNSRIAELETELQDARDLSRMADQFVDALFDEVEGAAPGRTETERLRERRHRREGTPEQQDEPRRDGPRSNGGERRNGKPPESVYSDPHSASPVDTDESETEQPDEAPSEEWETPTVEANSVESDNGTQVDEEASGERSGDESEADPDDADVPDFDPDAIEDAFGAFETDDTASEASGENEKSGTDDGADRSDVETEAAEAFGGEFGDSEESAPSFESFEEPEDAPTIGESDDTTEESPMTFSEAEVPEFGFETPAADNGCGTNGDQTNGGSTNSDHANDGSDDASIAAAIQSIEDREITGSTRPEPPSVGDLRATIRNLDPKARRMLAYYNEHGPVTPLDAHFVAGGTGDRTDAYAHNSKLRAAELIEHVGRGKYDTCLDDRLKDATGGKLNAEERATFLARLESLLTAGQ